MELINWFKALTPEQIKGLITVIILIGAGCIKSWIKKSEMREV